MPGEVPARPRIGVFDSGVGGLSIYSVLRQHLPGAHYIYCSDNLNYPYGTKSAEVVIAAVRHATTLLIEKYKLDLLIIACNTASTVALPHLRSEFKIPVVGVVPAIKPAAQLSRTKTIGLLATPATVQRPYTDELIQNFAADCVVERVGSKVLVDMAEAKLRGEPISVAAVAAEIAPFFEKKASAPVDVVVLGCTHFPLLKAELDQAAVWPVQWVDSGEAIAARTKYLLGEADKTQLMAALTPLSATDFVSGVAVFTKADASLTRLQNALATLRLPAVEVLSPT